MSLSLRAYMSLNWNLQVYMSLSLRVCKSLSLRQVYMTLSFDSMDSHHHLSFDWNHNYCIDFLEVWCKPHMNSTLIGHYYRVENWIAGYHGMSRGRYQRHNKTKHHFCPHFYNFL